MLAYHISLPVICAMAMNGFIYTFDLRKNNSTPFLYLPPGQVIGTIWIILFGLLGYVHFLLFSLKNKMNFGSVSVAFFILTSLAYPVINAVDAICGYIFQFISLILSFVVGLIVMMYSKRIFLYMIPVLLWVSYVNFIVLHNILENKMS